MVPPNPSRRNRTFDFEALVQAYTEVRKTIGAQATTAEP